VLLQDGVCRAAAAAADVVVVVVVVQRAQNGRHAPVYSFIIHHQPRRSDQNSFQIVFDQGTPLALI
jgi:hypothetical protein